MYASARWSRMALFWAALLTTAATSQAEMRVGEVSRLQGQGFRQAGEVRAPLPLQARIERNDVVGTGAASRMEITFRDRTQVTLGEKASLRIDRFVFDPEARAKTLSLAAVGAVRFVSGIRGSSGVEVRTPVAVIGVRGTDFWTGPIDGQFGVLLLEGAVSVANSAGQVVLDRPGTGVNIAGPGQPPGAVTTWPADKVRRALAMVALP